MKTCSFNELDRIAEKIGKFVNSGDVIALVGDLGTGKTTFTQKVAGSMGITEPVRSPTFNIVKEYYSGKVPLFHYDVYRISDPEEIYETGYEDYLNGGGVVIIEWANLIMEQLPDEYILVELFYNDDISRKINISYIGNKMKEEEILNNVDVGN